jgi:glycosyltransferase involved in cell wall biosynthesis
MSLASLFVFHCCPNTGYAIAPLEKLFYEAGLDLAGEDSRHVHFGYPSLGIGPPTNLPAGFANFVEFDTRVTNPRHFQSLTEYVKKNGVRFALFFDVQPVHPVFRWLRRAGVGTILAYHGAPISGRMPSWKLMLKKMQVNFSRSKVDGLIFESQAMADLAISGRGVPRHMIDIVPLGVDIDLFHPGQSDYVYEVTGLPRDRKVVIYVGHMEERKGVRTLIEGAIELLARRKRRDVCFLIFGNREGESKRFEEMYAGLGIKELICFGGYRQDLAKIYRGCFCGIIPSTGWDSFPRSAIEMAASGLPVVASRLQGLQEAVLDGETGVLYPPGDAQALAGCLEALLNQEDSARQYGQRGRKRCENELNLESQRVRFQRVLRKRLHQSSVEGT